MNILVTISNNDDTRVNKQIKADEVRTVTEDGEFLGVLSLKEALKEAKKRDLDLVEISPNANPPVCKIIDHGKYKYKQQKKEQKQSKGHQPELKTLKLSFSISDHDMEIRAKEGKKFLKRGDRVRVVLPLRGRENALQDKAEEKMEKFVDMLKEDVDVRVDKELKKEPRGLTMTLSKK